MATVRTEAVLADVAPDRQNGQVQVVWGHYSYADEGAVAINDVIQMVPIPKDARILDILVEWNSTWDAGSTFDVGDGDDDDRFLAAIAMANSGRMSLFGGLSNGAEIDEAINASGLGYTYSAADTIDITIEGAAADTGDTITMAVLYVCEGGFDDE